VRRLRYQDVVGALKQTEQMSSGSDPRHRLLPPTTVVAREQRNEPAARLPGGVE
jgi:hypothetical protein